jgi:molybdenum cofactor cytidylyltransferase
MELVSALRLNLMQQPDVVAVTGGGGKTSIVFRLAREIVARGLRVVTATTTRVTLRQLELAPIHLRLPADTRALPLDALARALERHGHCLLVGDETLLNGKQMGVTPDLIDALAAHAKGLGLGAILLEADGSRTLPVKAPADHEPVVPHSTTLLLPVMGMEAVGVAVDDAHAHRADRLRALLGMDDAPAPLTPRQAARLLLHPNGGAKGLPTGARLLPIFNKAETAPRLAAARVAADLAATTGAPTLIAAAGVEARAPVLERWGPVAVIVLAAGASHRFGAAKQTALVEGEALAHRAVRTALESGAQQVIMVTGAHAAEVETAVADLMAQYAASHNLRLVHNADWAQGQSTSLRAGLEALPNSVQAVICLPVDQPWMDQTFLRRMIALWRAGSNLVAPTVAGALRGAPALFDCSHFAALAAITGDQGGRTLLQMHPVTPLPATAAMLADIDTPEDLHG